MEKLYESKGLNSKHKMMTALLGVIMIIVGIVLIALSQTDELEESSTLILIFGIGALALSLQLIESVIMGNRSYINVYNDHIEGLQITAFIVVQKKPFNLTYKEISSVELIQNSPMATPMLTIYTGATKIRCQVEGAREASVLIKERIGKA